MNDSFYTASIADILDDESNESTPAAGSAYIFQSKSKSDIETSPTTITSNDTGSLNLDVFDSMTSLGTFTGVQPTRGGEASISKSDLDKFLNNEFDQETMESIRKTLL
mmetsp:Transcript_3865/g.3295  ORF Transcript_3865/g.3295 Transcript_3865/m.3295 type:complete len:108 (-) Transcript_3865:446-769(-)